MTTPGFAALRGYPNMTTFAFSTHIDSLIRSADWYNVPAIHRYLFNMAASDVRMEDMKTEARSYTYEKFEHLGLLIERSLGQEAEVAWEAWMLWSDAAVHFGVVHLDQADGRRGNVLIGDSMRDYREFAPEGDGQERWTTTLKPSHGPEGSDV